NPLLRQLQAEIFGVPVTRVNREEGPAYGAALLAAVGVGAFSDISSAARATIQRHSAEAASFEAHRAYDAPYARFHESYRVCRLLLEKKKDYCSPRRPVL